VLTITTDPARKQSMQEALRRIRIPHSPGASLFFFLTKEEAAQFDLLVQPWQDGNNRSAHLT
jgi:hypothetical protein